MDLDYILKQLIKKGADDVVISSTKANSSQVKFVNNEIATTKNSVGTTIELFVVKNKRIASTTIKSTNKQEVDRKINRLMKFINYLRPKEDYYGLARGPFKYKSIKDTYDRKICLLGDKSIDIVEKAISQALANGAERTAGTLNFGSYETELLTSNNVRAKDKGTDINLSIRAFAAKNASSHKVAVSRTLSGLNLKKASEAGLIARQALNPKKGIAGRFDVLFDPLPFAVLLGAVMDSASIYSVESGLSFFASKLGKQVANPNITLIDDATLPNGISSSMFDDEGVPSKRTFVIKDGILRTYLHNTSTARKYHTKTTASAGLLAPEPSNIILKRGRTALEEMISRIKKGLYITNTWYMRFQNYTTGDFSTIPRDAIFMIKNGKIISSVSDIRLSDNMLNILKNIIAIGNKPEQILGWEAETPTITPPVLVKNLNITKSTS